MAGRAEGKVALITGAARGQGRSHALRLAQEGADIIAVDSCEDVGSVRYPLATPENLATTVREVETLDRRIIAARADVRDHDAMARVVGDAVGELGRLDIVASNAGIHSVGAIADLPVAVWQDMIDINLTGNFNTVKACIPHLVEGGRGGSIVITSSAIALRPVPHMGHYTSAKQGLIGLMKTLALELAPHRIRVNSIHPTTVDTEMIHNQANYDLFVPDATSPTLEQVEPVFRTLNALPTPWVDADDISNALMFLASDEARYITGVALPVDAGFSLL